MKRCPQCDFIYEDDQSLCDMDGILLVFDSQKLPKQAVLAKFRLRTWIVPVMGVLVLATVLSFVYYVATRRSKALQAGYPTTQINAETAPEEVSAKPSGDNAKSAGTSESTVDIREPKPVSKSKPKESGAQVDRESKKPSSSKSVSAQKQAGSNQPQENDSKLESFMKKTGRLLKKPFKH